MSAADLNRRDLIGAAVAATALGGPAAMAGPADTIKVRVDLASDAGPLDHIWSRCAGSDRAAITLREGWRQDLDRFRREAGLERVRFHGIFNDELGVWPDPATVVGGRAGDGPNFQNVDTVYDGLLRRGVRPFVELSFMPGKLASGPQTFGFYKANVTPPTSMADWAGFLQQFARHLIGRYGAPEVRRWDFEVWNEPNLAFFWAGTQAQYFELYKAAVQALKAVDPALRVGGPATSAVQWIPEFLAFCNENRLPVDFVSTHIYPADKQAKIFGGKQTYSQNDVIPAAMAMVRAQIDASPYRGAELWLGEWSSDSPAMIAHVIKGCLPYCHAMSQWVMSSVYEELGVSPHLLQEGTSGWGMLAQHSIAKPAFNTYKLMNRLGRRRVEGAGPVLATRTGRDGAAILVWNLAETSQPNGIPGALHPRSVHGAAHRYEISLAGAKAGRRASVTYVDQDRGSPLPAWRAMGSPQYPTPAQIDDLRRAADLGPPEPRKLGPGGKLVIELPPEGVALIEL